MTVLGAGSTAQSEPDARRFADDSAEEIEEIEEIASVPAPAADDGQLPVDRFLDARLLHQVAQAPRIGRTAFTFGCVERPTGARGSGGSRSLRRLWPGVARARHRRWAKIG